MTAQIQASNYDQIYFPALNNENTAIPKMRKIDRLFNYFIKNSDESARVIMIDLFK